ncbi:unannotated protein [freshwater metagenome]|uniref:Unannotated protein n=1 Tax=freshwater metagenome TaxID=449393 RepID=A0A6J6AQJ0_9ZZZZ
MIVEVAIPMSGASVNRWITYRSVCITKPIPIPTNIAEPTTNAADVEAWIEESRIIPTHEITSPTNGTTTWPPRRSVIWPAMIVQRPEVTANGARSNPA